MAGTPRQKPTAAPQRGKYPSLCGEVWTISGRVKEVLDRWSVWQQEYPDRSRTAFLAHLAAHSDRGRTIWEYVLRVGLKLGLPVIEQLERHGFSWEQVQILAGCPDHEQAQALAELAAGRSLHAQMLVANNARRRRRNFGSTGGKSGRSFINVGRDPGFTAENLAPFFNHDFSQYLAWKEAVDREMRQRLLIAS